MVEQKQEQGADSKQVKTSTGFSKKFRDNLNNNLQNPQTPLTPTKLEKEIVFLASVIIDGHSREENTRTFISDKLVSGMLKDASIIIPSENLPSELQKQYLKTPNTHIQINVNQIKSPDVKPITLSIVGGTLQNESGTLKNTFYPQYDLIQQYNLGDKITKFNGNEKDPADVHVKEEELKIVKKLLELYIAQAKK